MSQTLHDQIHQILAKNVDPVSLQPFDQVVEVQQVVVAGDVLKVALCFGYPIELAKPVVQQGLLCFCFMRGLSCRAVSRGTERDRLYILRHRQSEFCDIGNIRCHVHGLQRGA